MRIPIKSTARKLNNTQNSLVMDFNPSKFEHRCYWPSFDVYIELQ